MINRPVVLIAELVTSIFPFQGRTAFAGAKAAINVLVASMVGDGSLVLS